MRVALYLRHFPARGAPLIGGTSIAVDGLAAGLAENGADVRVLCEGRSRTTVRADAGYVIECFPSRRPYHSFTLSPELARYAERELAPARTLCLVNGMFHPGVYAMARTLQRCRVPYVAVPHDPYERAVFHRNPHLKWPYWYLFERRLLRRARAVQVLNMKHAACLRRLGIDTPVIETPNGVACRSELQESSLRWSDTTEPARLVFLGRIDAYNKGLDMLIDAFARVAESASVKLTVQGPDWGDRARLQRRAAAWGLGDRVEFRGPDYGRASPHIVAEHDMFCLPSRFEGFGLAALEAMIVARVLLVSEETGIASHVAASGCGVAVRASVSGIEAGLLNLLQRRDEWPVMGSAGRRYALSQLQWKRIAAAALERYAGMIA
ncbi:MAG TPA: glycosyltransferase [Burkholderiales bacterium]|jgi:glycosyltransferase involved in cell wall biosynthesis|nr:glycosyltransferase [Burkholderiales bacterium]